MPCDRDLPHEDKNGYDAAPRIGTSPKSMTDNYWRRSRTSPPVSTLVARDHKTGRALRPGCGHDESAIWLPATLASASPATWLRPAPNCWNRQEGSGTLNAPWPCCHGRNSDAPRAASGRALHRHPPQRPARGARGPGLRNARDVRKLVSGNPEIRAHRLGRRAIRRAPARRRTTAGCLRRLSLPRRPGEPAWHRAAA